MLLALAERTDRALSLFGIFKYIGVIALVLLLAYLTTRLVSKGYMRGFKTGEFELVDKLILAPDKSLVLVRLRAEDVYYILALDKTGTHVVDKLQHLNLTSHNTEDTSPLQNKSFKDIFNKFGGDKK